MSAAIEQVELEENNGPAVPDKVRFATKTALSLTLAYLIPMALGWPQPQTAAITVMLIAATGSLSESLQKGVLRTLGTVAGAVIGLSLIALFPQDRMLYLAAMSVVVTILLYLYNAFQGDSTIFMLAIVVALMVFNGGDAEGAFIYGIDRTLLTAFGVLIYSLVGSFLWPVKIADNTVRLGAAVTAAFARTSPLLRKTDTSADRQLRESEVLEDLLGTLEAFRSHYVAVKLESDAVQAYQAEWSAILGCYERLEAIVIPALRTTDSETENFERYINNHTQALENLDNMLRELQACWTQDAPGNTSAPIEIAYNSESLQQEKHLTVAAVINRGNLLTELQDLLQQLTGAVSSLRFDRGRFRRDWEVHSTPSFIWLDRENLKTALRGFITFWLATFIWINYNPPGGFMFVTMSTALVALVSYTPVTPKLLIFLFTLGFIFALPAYVFLLPAMTHWLELAVFLFAYAFIGFFIFPGPVSIFFLLGLFTLGIQNSMNYNFNVILLVILMFYMVCALLIVSVHFPFTSKPQLLYIDFRRRFLRLCADIIRSGPPGTGLQRLVMNARLTSASALLGKMQQWGPMIDTAYFPGISADKINAFNHSCDNLLGRLRALTGPMNPYGTNPIINKARRDQPSGMAAVLCDTLAMEDGSAMIDREFTAASRKLKRVEEQLNAFLDGDADTPNYTQQEKADFYLFINLQASLLASLEQCRESLENIDWRQLRETKF